MKQLVIDVREPEEYRLSHVKGAINIPLADLRTLPHGQLSETPKDTKIIVYCRSGNRSNEARNLLEQHGYTNIVDGVNKVQVETKHL